MTKILNLDKLVEEKRVLKLFGKEFEIEAMTVDNFLITSFEADKLKGEQSVAVQIDAAVKLLQRSIPSCPEDVLRKLPLAQLQTVTAFVRGDDDIGGVESKEDKSGK